MDKSVYDLITINQQRPNRQTPTKIYRWTSDHTAADFPTEMDLPMYQFELIVNPPVSVISNLNYLVDLTNETLVPIDSYLGTKQSRDFVASCIPYEFDPDIHKKMEDFLSSKFIKPPTFIYDEDPKYINKVDLFFCHYSFAIPAMKMIKKLPDSGLQISGKVMLWFYTETEFFDVAKMGFILSHYCMIQFVFPITMRDRGFLLCGYINDDKKVLMDLDVEDFNTVTDSSVEYNEFLNNMIGSIKIHKMPEFIPMSNVSRMLTHWGVNSSVKSFAV